MIWKLVAIVIAAALIIVGITAYLTPDDLAHCSAPGAELPCATADAIVVISGGDTDARTDEAIKLFKDGWAPMIIVSGAAADKTSISNAEAMRQRAVANGVPETAIIAEPASETTKQNASEVSTILAKQSASRIILVTSGYHMRRAGLEFSAQLGTDMTVVRHPVASDKQWSAVWWLTPWGWWIAMSELVKIGAFYVGGTR